MQIKMPNEMLEVYSYETIDPEKINSIIKLNQIPEDHLPEGFSISFEGVHMREYMIKDRSTVFVGVSKEGLLGDVEIYSDTQEDLQEDKRTLEKYLGFELVKEKEGR